ncbi:MAG TPA: UDP-glucose/GDP-mannose dehydrogenase family protein [Bryobacteraceae bacterium]|jgi:UDPglucose 6-dehydrogenase|nr:UDP-glucose/GDP-mannose dehydrogenase family protein [Bryobacteraceae bacterium]
MNVSIIGTGYVGLTTGACLAFLGHKVTCIDSDEKKIALLQAGKTPIYEPFLTELLEEALPNLQFCRDYAAAVPTAEVIFIAVGTPPSPDGSPDLRYLSQAARGIGQYYDGEYVVVVNKSTVPIGSGNWVGSLVRESYEQHHGKKPNGQFSVASNPEFLREGTALHDSLYPDRVVIGSDDARSLEMLYTLYRPILDQTFAPPTYLPRPEELGAVPLISTELASAELIKYAANAFLALKISYINEIGQLAEKVGADIQQVAKGIGLDARIGTRFLQAGIGWGGSCFGKDISALVSTASEYNLTMPIVDAAREINRRQRERVVEKLLGELKILKGRTIGLLGLAFKPNTDDLREAPAIDIARKLVERGCKVKVHDPVAMERFQEQYRDLEVICCETPEETANDADAVVLVTEWQQYRELDWEALAGRMRSRIVLDGRNALDRARLTRFGFRYIGIGG